MAAGGGGRIGPMTGRGFRAMSWMRLRRRRKPSGGWADVVADPIAVALEHVHTAFYAGNERRWELELAYMALVYLNGNTYRDRYGKRWEPNDETRIALERAWHALHGQRPDSLLWHEWREIAVRVREAGQVAGVAPRKAAEDLRAWLAARYAKQCPKLDELTVSKLGRWLASSVDGERKPSKGRPSIARVMAKILIAAKAKPTLAGTSGNEDSLTRQIAAVIVQQK
jgi:hypothetical protein